MNFKLRLSRKRHIPIFCAFGREYYLWHIPELALCWHYEQKYRYQKYTDCINFNRLNFLEEIRVWDKHYLPRGKFSRDPLVLDAGSGEGETLVFFATHGFRNFLAVEINDDALTRAIEVGHRLGVSLRVRCGSFALSDLNGVGYAKIDVEGGEKELLALSAVPCEMVVEVHGDKLMQEFLLKWPQLSVEWKWKETYDYGAVYLIRLFPTPSSTER